MVMQIAFGIFFGVIFLAVLAIIILAVAYIVGKKQDDIPHFIKEPEPKPRKRKQTIQEWWDGYDEGDDY